MSKFILALHVGHNASAAIGDRSGLNFAIQEERLNGEKNYWGLPRLALRACLARVGANAADLLEVVHGGGQALARYHSRDDVLEAYRRQDRVVGRVRQRLIMPWLVALRRDLGHAELETMLAEEGLGEVPLRYEDHHRAHAATGYFGLRRDPDSPYLVLTCDGAGDGLCATVRKWSGGAEDLLATSTWESSLGAIYSWVTYMLGFVPLEHEYKLMGMAPYAPSKAAEEVAGVFSSYLGLDGRGLSFRAKKGRTNDLRQVMDRDLRGMRFDYVCAGLQRFTEDLLAEWTSAAVRQSGVPRVVAAGGVFMNVKANKRIAELEEVESFEAFPSCGDETLSIGAYYLAAARHYGPEGLAPLAGFYLGDSPEEEPLDQALRESGFAFERPVDMGDAVAELLSNGEPVARCAGRMEFGARALGNRSILADPSNQDVVRVINQMVKKRDFWMPFAPIVMEDDLDRYVHNPKGLRSPYMMMTFDTRENFRDLIAAVHNADLTCRAQALRRGENPGVEAILDRFASRTGRRVLLNTSFNLHGFPIVRTATEALQVLRESGLRYLQLGPFLVRKEVRR